MARRTKQEQREWERKRTAIVAVYNSGGDWKQLSENLSIPKTTAYRWCKEGEKKDNRGGKRFSKLSNVHLDFLSEYISANVRITTQEMVEKLKNERI